MGWTTSANKSTAWDAIATQSPAVKWSAGADIINQTTADAGSVTVYAIWKQIQYTVKYNSNGGVGAEKTHNGTFTYDGDAIALEPNSFTKFEQSFTGWSTNAGASTKTYDDGASVKNLTSTKNGVVILYAIWGDLDYTLGLRDLYFSVITWVQADYKCYNWTEFVSARALAKSALGATGNETAANQINISGLDNGLAHEKYTVLQTWKGKVVNTKALETAVLTNADKTADGYTTATWLAFAAERTVSSTLLARALTEDGAILVQNDIDAQLERFNIALGNLSGDLSALTVLYNRVKDYKNQDFQSGFAAFEAALGSAASYVTTQIAPPNGDAYNELMLRVQALKVDTTLAETELSRVVSNENVYRGYTEWVAAKTILQTVVTSVASGYVSFEEYTEKLNATKAAYAGIIYKTDATELQKAIAYYRAHEADYTDASFNPFRATLNTLDATIEANPAPGAELVADWFHTLEIGAGALVLRTTEPTNPPVDPGNPGGGATLGGDDKGGEKSGGMLMIILGIVAGVSVVSILSVVTLIVMRKHKMAALEKYVAEKTERDEKQRAAIAAASTDLQMAMAAVKQKKLNPQSAQAQADARAAVQKAAAEVDAAVGAVDMLKNFKRGHAKLEKLARKHAEKLSGV
jgi:hypothetical protein